MQKAHHTPLSVKEPSYSAKWPGVQLVAPAFSSASSARQTLSVAFEVPPTVACPPATAPAGTPPDDDTFTQE